MKEGDDGAGFSISRNRGNKEAVRVPEKVARKLKIDEQKKQSIND